MLCLVSTSMLFAVAALQEYKQATEGLMRQSMSVETLFTPLPQSRTFHCFCFVVVIVVAFISTSSNDTLAFLFSNWDIFV